MLHKLNKKISFGLTLAVLVSLLLAPFALADDISNNLDMSIDAVAEVMPLTVGGANGTTQLYVTTRNGDGKNGCNLTGSTVLVVSVSSSDIAVATVSPSSVTFTSCGDTPTLTVTPHSQGSATISVSQTSNTTDGTFNLAPATFTVNVAPPPNTPPQVSVAGVTGGTSYNKGSVPAATCQVTDAEDGNSSFPATLSAITGPYAEDGIGQQTASCSYTDAGGQTAVTSETYNIVDPSTPSISYTLTPASPDGLNGWYKSDVTLSWTVIESESPNSLEKTGCVDQSITTDQAETAYSCSASSAGGSATPVTVAIKRDATKPTISGSRDPDANSYGWNNTDVTVSFTCNDNLSGVASCSDPTTLDEEGADQSATGTVTDEAGNSASATVSGINIDKTKPALSGAPTTSPNPAGWYNSNVTIAWTCSDTLSGIDGICPPDNTIAAEGTGLTASASVSDKAGNSTTATSSPAVNIDKTAPVVSVTGVSNGATYTLGSVPAAGCSTTDALSGVATEASLSISGGPVGSVTATCSGAMDNAGNPGSASVTYNVIYDWTGFFQPVDNDVLNVAKAGSAIPVKFSLSGYQGMNIISLGYPKAQVIDCDNRATQDVIEETVTAGLSSLSYDATADQYNYVWKTNKAWAGTCRQFTLMLIDGETYTFDVSFKK